ncbi:MAG: 16S rRNA (cytosine(1402)-N(4))-methyltransferase RsmH [Patescibacteria group bacterium]|jgi:16S rRNA (cytosine1402-N4)-methyltransferase
MTVTHVPVLLHEVIESLDPRADQHFIDGTVGGGGHSEAILKRTGPDGCLLGIDRDQLAVTETQARLQSFGSRITLVHDSFSNIKQIYNEQFSNHQIDGILLDLGLSTLELEDQSRGFSFQVDAPLDMRFDSRQELTAADIVNTWPLPKLTKVIQEYGEERLAYAIAKQIVSTRLNKKISKTKMLVEAILLAFRDKLHSDKEVPWIGGLHPATRTFQALRIAVNDEIGSLGKALPQAIDILKPGGRVAVISFHSLEDRIVKNFFRHEAKGCICPPAMPVCQCGHTPCLKIITKHPIKPSEEEIQKNPRSRSALLRVAEKV